jgi:beta-phosphoglucomutase-like phosphatase (HAD superfamily)
MMNEVVLCISEANLDSQELLRIKHAEFEALEHLAVPIEGAAEFVNWAKTQFRIALATSATPRNRQVALQMLGLSDKFDFVVDKSGFSRPKPNPEVFQKGGPWARSYSDGVSRHRGFIKRSCRRKAAGCHVMGITTSFTEALLLSEGADYVIHTFHELRSLLSGRLHFQIDIRD